MMRSGFALCLLLLLGLLLVDHTQAAGDCEPGFQCFMPSDGMGFNDDPGRPRIPIKYREPPKKDKESRQARVARLNKQRMGELDGSKKKRGRVATKRRR